VLVKTQDRAEGVRRALELLAPAPLKDKRVVLKPNFNSAHAFPGSTHPDTLTTLVGALANLGAAHVTVADRSGMGNTRSVMTEKRIFDLGKRAGFESVVLDELPESGLLQEPLSGGHWQRGVYFPTLFHEAEALVQTCCLKTHGSGGHFTLSLKNSVGMVARYSPADGYDFMRDLHRSPSQRLMIAELNQLYTPDFVLLDAMEGFIAGGPATGTAARPQAILAGTDRIAVDAVGVAMLRLMGTQGVVAQGRIFDQEQIARAVELGLGVKAADQIDIVTPDAESRQSADQLEPILLKG
jgi:uncharacterized protein (DUF362 family)